MQDMQYNFSTSTTIQSHIASQIICLDREVELDLIRIDKKAVLHVVDLETQLSTAAFLEHQTVESVTCGHLCT